MKLPPPPRPPDAAPSPPGRRSGRPACGTGLPACAGRAALLSVLLLALPAAAQTPLAGKVTGFKYPGYDPQGRLRSLVMGGQAQPGPAGLILIQQLRLETYRESGDLDLVAEAPECAFDVNRRILSSPGRLQAGSADQRFAITGEGFEYQQAVEALVISNDVHTTIRRGDTNELPAAGEPQPEKPLEIFAGSFRFEQASKLAVYQGDVRVDDAEMDLTCGELKVRLAEAGGAFERIEAEQDVVILSKADQSRATADRAVYDRGQDRMELTGNAAWQQGRREGTAEVIAFHRLARSVQADGRVRMQLPREAFGKSGFLFLAAPSPAPSAPAATEVQFVHVAAEHFQTLSNLTLFRGEVRVHDATNRLDCDTLLIQSATPDDPEDIVTAAGSVRVAQGARLVTAEQAVYTRSTDMAVFTGQAQWRMETTEGRGETLIFHPGGERVQARGDAFVKVSRAAGAGSFLPWLTGDTNAAPAPAGAIEIHADEFELHERLATFTGGVRARETPGEGAEPRLQSGRLQVQFAGHTNRAERITAREAVVIEQGISGVTNGPARYQKLGAEAVTAEFDPATGAVERLLAEEQVVIVQPGALATGQRAEYVRATEQFVLTGNPAVDLPEMTITEAQAIVWDRAQNAFSAQPPYKIREKRTPPPAARTGPP